MSTRYALRSKGSTKRKRPSTIDPPDDTDTIDENEVNEQAEQLKSYLKTVIENLMQDELQYAMDEVDARVSKSFKKNLKKTSDQFAKLTIDKVKDVILESCHDMIHQHLDGFDLTLSTKQFRKLIADVIKVEFGGKLNGQTPKTPRGTTILHS